MGLAEKIQFCAKTDTGRVRDINEDNFLVDRKLSLFLVADGMGGHAAGEVASAIAVRMMHNEIRKSRHIIEEFLETGSRDAGRRIHRLLEQSIQTACARIHEEAKADSGKRGMGTTLSALLVAGKFGFIAHVGDSRIYLLRDGRVQQVTEDHTVYNELIKRGRLTKDQIERVAQKNAITRAVGVYERVEVDALTLEVLPQDCFLLCSDGLCGYINHNAELEPYLDDDDPDRAATELVDLANRKGGKDNITAVIVRLGGDASDDRRRRLFALKRDVLAQVPLFSRLDERELLRVMQVSEVLSFEPGRDVVTEGTRGDELFIVLEGALNIVRGDQVLSDVGPGEHFGEMALIRATPRSATVRAVERSEVISLRRRDFYEIIRNESQIAVKLLWQFLGVLADRLDQTSRDLSTAKTELAAEDITNDIFELEEAEKTRAKAAEARAKAAGRSPSTAPHADPDASEGAETSKKTSQSPVSAPAAGPEDEPKAASTPPNQTPSAPPPPAADPGSEQAAASASGHDDAGDERASD